MPELWDLYNEKREPLGETHERGKPLPDGKFHIVANVLPVNLDGKILITKRSPEKKFRRNVGDHGRGTPAGKSFILLYGLLVCGSVMKIRCAEGS